MRWALLIAAAAACAPPPAEVPSPVAMQLSPEAWVESSVDPFGDRPDGAECGPGGFVAEGSTLEVETGVCRYLTATQPLPERIEPGQVVRGFVWHLDLYAEAPAEAHVAIRLGGETVFETAIPIPSGEAVHSFEWIAPGPLEAGTPAYFHLHNHGANSWRLSEIEVE